MLKRGKLLARLISLFVEIASRREKRRNFGARWSIRRRHSLLPPEELVINICAEFMKLCWREPKQFVLRFA
jgi:hypothetical protein